MRGTSAWAAALLGTLLLSGCDSSSATGTATPPTRTAAPGTPSAAGGPAAQTPVPVESNPSGDIPDTVAFVPYNSSAGRYRFSHPEGWAQTGTDPSVAFTDKLDGVTVATGPATAAPTVQQARDQSAAALRQSQPAFELVGVSAVSGSYGSGVRIVYRRNSAPDPVTGRQYRDEVQRYEVVGNGHEVVVELYGPVGADNADAYKTMINSLVIA